jgi:hypothetical protein
MSDIEISSGLETIITSSFHYRFHWMGDHWKQEIVSAGGCQAIPQIWSIEGLISHRARLEPASPAYQRLEITKESPAVSVAHLQGRAGPNSYSGAFTFEERPDEVVIDIEVTDRSAKPGKMLAATYLVQSSPGRLQPGESATITWHNPETRLVFEAEPPARVEAHEAGMGTIRLRAWAEPDPSSEIHTLRYRWRWVSVPGHQIWDRDV